MGPHIHFQSQLLSIPFRNLYEYRSMERVDVNGKRHYTDPDGGPLMPSVTTILDATSNKSFLIEWERRVGKKKAGEIKKQATDLGSLMHLYLENWVQGLDKPPGNNFIHQQAWKMGDVVIREGLPNVSEVHGMEVMLHFPELYAGTTDLVGIWKGRHAIMDYKTAKVIRKREQIQGYLHQMAAYALAHNLHYGTNIRTGVVFMVSRDLEYKEFVIDGDEFDDACAGWLNRVFTYHGLQHPDLSNLGDNGGPPATEGAD